MKILFIAFDINTIGGIQRYTKKLFNVVCEEGHDAILVELKDIRFFSKVRFTFSICKTTFLERPDFIICTNINFSPICFFLKKVSGTPYTVNLYGIDAIDIKSKLKVRSVVEAERVIVISDYTRDKALEQIPEIKERIFFLPSAVDGSLFFIKNNPEYLRERYNLGDAPIIVTVARLNQNEFKGYYKVAEAMPYILKEIPNAKYLIVGQGADSRISVLLKNPVIKNSVILTGPAKDGELVDFYNLADVFAMPSKIEGFAIVFIEALACGTPVVASDGYGCRKGLLNGELGLLVNPDDSESIAKAIIRILKKDVPEKLLDRKWVRERSLSFYGVEKYQDRVRDFLHILSKKK